MQGTLMNDADGAVLLDKVRWCSSFFCKLRGLMFRKSLAAGEGLLLVESYESRIATAIHMLFMRFPIATIWLDKDFRVVDKKLARPWQLSLAPNKPAQYTLETHPHLLDSVEVGNRLIFEEDAP